ncbi:MAG: hypothetical protein ABJN36_04090 [Cyclobacteriaceae bacterium]
MNKSIKFLSMLLSIAMVSVFISCSEDDDPIIIDEDPVVSDGFYLLGSSTGDTPAAALELGAGTVGSGETREGFYAAYIYLEAGSFNFVLYSNNEPTSYGGSFEGTPLAGNEDYSLNRGDLTVDGAAVTITNAGLYHVHVDLTTNLFFFTEVGYFEIIGSATADSWNSGQKLDVKSASAEGVVFEGTDITLRTGNTAFKFRYNSNWDTNILDDAEVDIEGLNIHSNFGVDVVAGGSDFSFDESDANFTVTVTYTPGKGESLTWGYEKTGEAEEISYDPTEHPWSLRGTAVGSPEDWSTGPLLTPNHDGSTYRWYGVIEITEGEFKVADGGVWLGVGAATDNSGVLTGTDNFMMSADDAGFYYIVVTTSDDGASYTATIDKASFGVIGSATAGVTGGDGWADDADMTEGTSSFTLNIALDAGEIKFRANNAWEYNLGGDLAGLTHNGDNIAISAAGTYDITLSTDNRGETYTATIQ